MTTLDLFTKPFPNPAGGEWKPLVKRVPEIENFNDTMMVVDERTHWPMGNPNHRRRIVESLLIVAAHEWAANVKWTVMPNVKPIRSALQNYGTTAEDKYLILACHLIADSLEAKP